ncbi:MAG: tetratricopeptide repeat protein [Kangiellaceae bacterium]
MNLQAGKLSESGAHKSIYVTEWAKLKHKAEIGDPEALFALGNYYYAPPKGSSFRQNYLMSADFYFQSGIRGNASAQYNLALMFHRGTGVKSNYIQSYAWFKLASNNQSPVAKHVNLVSSQAVETLEIELNEEELIEAKKLAEFYKGIIASKRYRDAKFPKQ